MNFSEYRIIHGAEGTTAQVTAVMKPALLPGESEEDCLKRIAKLKGGSVVKVGDKKVWPASTQYRSAWRYDPKKGKINVDLNVAIEHMVERIRFQRDGKLAELDVPSMRALEDGDTEKSAEIKERKQMLRDLPEVVRERLDNIANGKGREATKLKKLSEFIVPELQD